MDDVHLLETTPTGKQNLLDIPDKVAETYHTIFGKKMVKNDNRENSGKQSFKLGEITLDHTGKYKYLGEITNKTMNLKDHIIHMEGTWKLHTNQS